MRSARCSEILGIVLVAVLALPGCTRSAKADRGVGEVLEVRVAKVVDGDTFHARVVGGRVPPGVRRLRDSSISIRLQGIDAPEHDQPWGDSSRAALETILAGGRARVVVGTVDKYHRIVGEVFRDSLDVCARMVGSGNAWMFRRYTDSPRLDSLESAARGARRGLWRAAQPVPPWSWRHRERETGSTR